MDRCNLGIRQQIPSEGSVRTAPDSAASNTIKEESRDTMPPWLAGVKSLYRLNTFWALGTDRAGTPHALRRGRASHGSRSTTAVHASALAPAGGRQGARRPWDRKGARIGSKRMEQATCAEPDAIRSRGGQHWRGCPRPGSPAIRVDRVRPVGGLAQELPGYRNCSATERGWLRSQPSTSSKVKVHSVTVSTATMANRFR